LLIDGHLSHSQPGRAQAVMDRLISGHLDPGAFTRIRDNLARNFHGLLSARDHDHLLWRTARRPHGGGVSSDCFAQGGQSITRAIFPVAAARAGGIAMPKAIPYLPRKQIDRR
jgi:hypothetical protein